MPDAGKSSALNTLTNQEKPGSYLKNARAPRLINLFEVADGKHLVGLPGYGYAGSPQEEMKRKWQRALSEVRENRPSLQGLVVLMDIHRHPLKDLDQQMIESGGRQQYRRSGAADQSGQTGKRRT
ncbi:GTPase [Escherichia coli]